MLSGGFRKSRIAAGVLAGGKGERFGGRTKGLLHAAPGISIVEKQVYELISSGLEEVIILTNNPRPYRALMALGPKIVPDLRAGLGPLGGIEAALSHYAGRFDATLFLPCDLPHITAYEITALLDGFAESEANVAVAVTGECNWEPLCAVVYNHHLPSVQDAIDRGVRKVREVWKELGVVLIHFPDPKPFFNINTPGELSRWMAEKGEGN